MTHVHLLRGAFSLPVIAIATITASLWALVLRLCDPSGNRVVEFARTWSRWILTSCGVRVQVVQRAALDPEQPYVFMANHLSSLDIWACFVAVPRRLRMIAKKQLARIPLLGWAMWAGRFIFVDRQNAALARRTIADAALRIQGGDSVLLFPEGTRSRDGHLQAFKKGGFHLAIDAGAAIVPVAIHGSRELMPRGSLVLRPGTVRVTLGEPISTRGLSAADRDILMAKVRGAIAGMLGETDDAARSLAAPRLLVPDQPGRTILVRVDTVAAAERQP